jgi:hypothetical protein
VTPLATPAERTTASNVSALAVLCALGLAILIVNAWIFRVVDAQLPQLYTYDLFVLPLMVSGLLTIVATKVATRVPAGIGIMVVLGFAIALRAVALAHPPLLSDDIYRYIWDGRVQGAGINPYLYIPTDPALASLRDTAIFPNITRADYAHTLYPPAAQFFFAAVTRLGESTLVMRLAMVGCEAVALALLIDLLRQFDKPITLATALAWHPLAVWEIANNGHVDALMMALMMLGVWLMARYRRLAGGLAVAVAVLVKPYALVAMPAFWRLWDWRLPLAVIAVAVLCYLPYLDAGAGVFGFLSGYVAEEGFESGKGFWPVLAARSAFGNLPGLVPLYLALAAATLGVLALRIAFRADPTAERTTRDIALLLMTALFFMSPNYPWYYIVLIPLIPLGGGAPAWVLTLGGFILYFLYPEYEAHFLLWKGALGVAFLIAALTTRIERVPAALRIPRGLPWMR